MGSHKQSLDFICIGAAKSGTTTLHEILKNHPQISLPAAKEVPFFNNPVVLEKGFDWYLKKNFSDAKPDSLWGTVTPQYMYSRHDFTPEDTAKNIKKYNPNVKLIVILRQPIDRAFSHYKTAQRRNGIDTKFDEAMSKILKDDNIKDRKSDWDPVKLSFYGSEYGKILEPYYKLFGKDNILVLYMDDLKKDPQKLIEKVCRYLEISTDFKPENAKGRYNPNGSKPKIALLTPKYLHKPFIRKSWQIVPYKIRKSIEVKVNSWNAKVDDEKLDKTDKFYKELWDYYSKDISQFEKISGQKTPWSKSKT